MTEAGQFRVAGLRHFLAEGASHLHVGDGVAVRPDDLRGGLCGREGVKPALPVEVSPPHAPGRRREAAVAVLVEEQLLHDEGILVAYRLGALHYGPEAIDVVDAHALTDGDRLRQRLVSAEEPLEGRDSGLVLQGAAVEEGR